MEKLLSLAVLIFFILLPGVEATSLGILVKNGATTLRQGESTKFTILFWNVENSPYIVEMKVESLPENWVVVVSPEKFLLDSNTGTENIFLPYKKEPVRAFPVTVFVKPVSARPGNYTIVLSASAGHTSNALNFFQERKFKLTVEVEGEAEVENISSKTTPNTNTPTGEIVKVQKHHVIYVVALICILFISVLIYKYG